MIPIPPSRWVTDRRNRLAFGKASTSAITDAPVVVNPDIVSKNASV
jgi:hypothetical protein